MGPANLAAGLTQARGKDWRSATGQLQDGTNTCVYGLDPSAGSGQALISATDGAGVQTYFLYDGLGSTTDLTDGSGNVIGGYSYDVFGGIRSQSGASDNFWLFTGEQRGARQAVTKTS